MKRISLDHGTARVSSKISEETINALNEAAIEVKRIAKIDRGFCPECSIGLNYHEMKLGYCQNCDASWEPRNL